VAYLKETRYIMNIGEKTSWKVVTRKTKNYMEEGRIILKWILGEVGYDYENWIKLAQEHVKW
jgi:hypothetical protein